MRWAMGAVAAVAVGTGLGVTMAVPAEAAIRCEGAYQVVRGDLIATPYCEDNYLAFVARDHGMRVSGRAIRASYNTKRRVCEFVGHDIRVQSICSGLTNEDRRGRIWTP